MKVRDIELVNTPHAERPHCGTARCRNRTPARHHATFLVLANRTSKTNRRWVQRLIGLCDECRGSFKERLMPKGKKLHSKAHGRVGVTVVPGEVDTRA